MELEHEHNEEQGSSSQPSKKKRRGPTTGKKYKTREPKFLEWSDNGKPIGKWANCFKTYIGDIVRTKIDITINNWDGVSDGLKDIIWEDVQKEFQLDNKVKGIVLRTVRERWKDFKTRLVSGWITKKRKLPADRGAPYEYYDAVTQAQWETFKKTHETEDFKEISEKARKCQACNVHPHYLGQAGYAGKKANWIVEGHHSSAMLPSGLVLDRSVDWIMARSKKRIDGNYEIPNEKTKLVAEKANELRQKAIEVEWTANRHDDVLSRALGKKEHPGRVRGVGGTVGIKDIFGEGEKKGPRGVISADQLYLITQDLEAKMRQEMEVKVNKMEGMMHSMVEQQVANILSKVGIEMPIAMGVNNITSNDHRSSHQSIHPTKVQVSNEVQATEPFAELPKPTKCRLAVNLDSNIIVVGSGMVHPASKTGDECHNQQILADHVKVGIDAVESTHEGTPLPVPTKYFSTIGEAVGSFVQWPKRLVLLRDNTGSISQPNKSMIGSNNDNVINARTNGSTKRNTLVDEGILKTLTKECRYFHDLVVQGPSDDNIINTIQVNKDLFKCDEDYEIKIRNNDIVPFLSMAWLNASWLQIYILWLNHTFNDLEVETIGFMCPHKLSQVRKSPDAANSYILKTWRESQSKRLLLAPHYEEKHCLLLVFHLQKSEVYVFDSRAESKRNPKIKAQVNVAFKLYRVCGCKSLGPTLNWKNVTCPKQSTSSDCVYYVMRYMYEIIKNHHHSIDLQKDFVQARSYSQEEMDEIRDQLSTYIVQNWI